MIITDVIKVNKAPKFVVKSNMEPTINDIRRIQDALKHSDIINRFASQVDMRFVWSNMNNKARSLKELLWEEADALPSEFLGEKEPLAVASASPRIELSEIRQMADRLNFVVIPFEYLNDNATVGNERRVIEAFVRNLPQTHLSYVLCPVAYYDINKHVQAKEDAPIYAGLNNQQAFMAINITIPMFRSMHRQLDQVKSRLTGVEINVQKFQSEIKNLTARVSQLEKYAEQELKRRLEQEAKVKELEQKLEQEQERRWMAMEPLLIGIPRRVSDIVEDDASCVAGPCWGPDFQDIVFTLLNLRKIKGQRQMMAAAAQKWTLN